MLRKDRGSDECAPKWRGLPGARPVQNPPCAQDSRARVLSRRLAFPPCDCEFEPGGRGPQIPARFPDPSCQRRLPRWFSCYISLRSTIFQAWRALLNRRDGGGASRARVYIPRNAGTAPAKTAIACRLVMDIYPPLVALFPGSHFLPGCSQAIDSLCHDISLSQICWGPHSQADPCGSASTDDVTGQKRHKLAHIADERRYVKNHFGCAASLSELTIHGKPHSQSARIRDFISGCQKRPQRSECVRALSFHPLTAPLQLEASFGIVVVKGIAGDEFAGLFSRNIAGLFFDNHS